MDATSVQVLISGAGPVGLTMACEALRHGLSCRIIDQRAEPTPPHESRALALWERTMEVFDNLGISDQVVARAKAIHGMNAYSEGRRIVHIGLDLEGMDTRYPCVLSLPQGQTERLLIERLHSLGGAVEASVKMTGLQQDEQGVTATLVEPDGREEHVRAAWLVGCDGAHSTVRHALGLGFEGSAYEESFRLADVGLDWELPDDEGHALFRPDGGALFALPMPGDNRWRLILVDAQKESEDEASIVRRFRSLLEANYKGRATLTDTSWAASFRVQRRIAERFRVGRCFLAGDAAHIHSPAGGQGMNTGIQDAANLAWKLALVNAGSAADGLLDTYQEERRPVAQGVLHGTDVLTRIMTLRHPVTLSIRNTLASILTQFGFVQRRIARALSEMDIDYRRSPLVAEDADSLTGGLTNRMFAVGKSPKAGDRVPDVACAAADGSPQRLFDILRDTRHTLLLFPGQTRQPKTNEEIEALDHLLSRRYTRWINGFFVVPPGEIKANMGWRGANLLDPHGHLVRRFGASNACLVLIRPDGYLGYRCQPPEAGKLVAYLDRHFWWEAP